MDNYLLFVYNHHHGIAYITNLNDIDVPLDPTISSTGKVALRFLHLVKGNTPSRTDDAARLAARELFLKNEGGFDVYYKVIRISDQGDMYDITNAYSDVAITITLTTD